MKIYFKGSKPWIITGIVLLLQRFPIFKTTADRPCMYNFGGLRFDRIVIPLYTMTMGSGTQKTSKNPRKAKCPVEIITIAERITIFPDVFIFLSSSSVSSKEQH